MAFSALKLTQQLQALQVQASFRSESEADTDGTIDLPDGYHVQIGEFYLTLNQQVDIPGKKHQGTRFGDARPTTLGLLRDIAAVPSLTTPALQQHLALVEKASEN